MSIRLIVDLHTLQPRNYQQECSQTGTSGIQLADLIMAPHDVTSYLYTTMTQ